MKYLIILLLLYSCDRADYCEQQTIYFKKDTGLHCKYKLSPSGTVFYDFCDKFQVGDTITWKKK